MHYKSQIYQRLFLYFMEVNFTRQHQVFSPTKLNCSQSEDIFSFTPNNFQYTYAILYFTYAICESFSTNEIRLRCKKIADIRPGRASAWHETVTFRVVICLIFSHFP